MKPKQRKDLKLTLEAALDRVRGDDVVATQLLIEALMLLDSTNPQRKKPLKFP